MPILHALLTLIGLGILLATLPLVLELFILSVAAAFPPRAILHSDRPIRLAAVIPAHDEQQLIASCVASLRASAGPSFPIYVIAHNCTDSTAARAAAAGAIVRPLTDTVGGKGNALHFGFTQALAAEAEAVLVIDADSTVSPNLAQAVAQALAAGSHAVQCRYLASNPETTPRTRLLALALLGMNVLRPRGRARLGLSCGIFGNGFALTAATLRAVPYFANSVVEDREYHLHLLRAGLRVDFLDHATVLGEMPTATPAAATQRARWEGGRILMRRQWTIPLFRDMFHGRLRMLEPLADLLSLPLATGMALLCAALLLPLFWLRLYAAFSFGIFALYVLVAATLSSAPAEPLKALFAAPAYLLWKLLMLPRTRQAARANAAWVRTARNNLHTDVPGSEAAKSPGSPKLP